VLDIYPGPVGSNPAHFVEHNDLLYFQASFPDYGAELWATDASKEGTFMVADIEPGIEGSFPELLTVFNTMIVFSASNHLHGREIWFSDGKARNDYSRSLIGTGLLADICSGTGSSNPAYFTMLNSKSLMLFQADDCVYGPELWRTDGTSSGTFMLVDINPGSEGSSPSSLTQFNNLVFFHADDGIHGPELWISDGSVKGTRILKDLSPGVEGSRPRFFTIFPSLQRVVFIATSRMDQTSELWQTDGTVIGTERIFMYSIEPLWLNERSMQMMNPSRLVNFEENLYFFGKSTSIQFEAGVGIVQDAAFVSVSCSKGLLELTGYHANIRVLRGSNSSSIDIVTPFYLINFILEKMIYRPQKDMLGRDEVYITIKLDDSNGISSSYTYLIMYVDIIHHNQPPVINMLPEYSVSIDDIVRVKNIALEDVDAGDGMLYLEITVNYGEVWIDYFDSRGRSAPTGAIKLYLTLADAKIALEQLMYRCPSESGCKAGMRDYLTIEVDDNGHDGAGGGKMSYMRSSISIYDEKIS
jgi:ELWxxDGT repeat protein